MGLLTGIARTAIIAGTATAVSNRVTRRQSGRWAAEDEAKAKPGYIPPPAGRYYGRYQYPMFQPRQASPPQPPPVDMSRKLAQLQQLGSLKEQGILGESEFEEQKQKILSD